MKQLLEQVFPADAGTLADVRSVVREACRYAGCSEDCREQVVLALNEACMNVIQHGYRFVEGQQFVLRLAVDDGILQAQLLDNGSPVSDNDLRPRGLEAIRPGGLGVHFMRELMDEVGYLPAPEGFVNCLQLRKRIC